MFHELASSESATLRPLFARMMDEHLVLASILGGNTPARIFVDHPAQPVSAFTGFHARMFLLGSPDNPAFNQDVRNHLLAQVIPNARAHGGEAFIFFPDSDAWLPELELILAGLHTIRLKRLYFRDAPRTQDWRSLLPEGIELRPVEAQLFDNSELQNLDLLREECCSERTSVEDFLAHSFGYCALHGSELAGWCLSEYNQDGRCEVGVATLEKFQRQGLGTAMTLALLDQAARLGYRQVGWHCWGDNLPSAALARRAGFELAHESNVYLCLFEQEKG